MFQCKETMIVFHVANICFLYNTIGDFNQIWLVLIMYYINPYYKAQSWALLKPMHVYFALDAFSGGIKVSNSITKVQIQYAHTYQEID